MTWKIRMHSHKNLALCRNSTGGGTCLAAVAKCRLWQPESWASRLSDPDHGGPLKIIGKRCVFTAVPDWA